MTLRRRMLILQIVLMAVAILLGAVAWPVLAQGEGAEAASSPPDVIKWAFLSAALVTGLSALGAAYAVAVVGGAAMGAVAEKPETAGRALVFVGLAEGIAIYGIIVAIMILGYVR
ncbi:MAG TPA: ATP synthase subunit C [Vicinamibacterales bacterium]|nr:ATP synthase subunit C [Vicinamibacterales bacterium]